MSDAQIIGMDLSYSDDYSSVSSVCSSCGHIIETKQYDSKIHGCEFTIFKKCPYCGVKLTRHVINE